jgi:methyl-accepting chemotaxis protein
MFGTKKRWRRRNFFINKNFQTRFILKFLGIVAVASAASGWLMYSLVNKDVEDVFYSSHIHISTTGQLLLPAMLKVNAGVLAFTLLAVALLTLFITHKVAGPVYRLGKAAEKISGGDFTGNFRLRENDELKGLANTFEEMNNGLKERLSSLRMNAEEISARADAIALAASRQSGLDAKEVDAVWAVADKFGRDMSRFNY